MKIIALVEVHPLSGGPSFITARVQSDSGEFEMPLSPEQAEIVLRHSAPVSQEMQENDMFNEEADELEYQTSPINQPVNSFPIDLDPDALVLKASGNPEPFFDNNQEYYDDDEL